MQVRMNLNSLVARKIVAISFQPLSSYKQECLSTHNTYICIYIYMGYVYIYAVYESVCFACVYVFVYACICMYHMNARAWNRQMRVLGFLELEQ